MSLSEKQHAAITLLALGKAGKDVAEELGVTPKTITTWRTDPEFRSAINQCLKDFREIQSRRLSGLCDKALTTIEESIDSESLKPEEKLKVAYKILEFCKITPEKIGATNAVKIAKQDFLEKL